MHVRDLSFRLGLLGAMAMLSACADLSPSRLGYEALQQRECSVQAGVGCPEQVGGYDAYRDARKQETGE